MLHQVMARIAGRFGRVEPRATARVYLLGLLSSVERKICWQLSERAGHSRPGPMQGLLRHARCDADAVRDDLRAYAAEHLGTDGGVLVVDETGFLIKGRLSAGVQRQHTGTAGRIENARVSYRRRPPAHHGPAPPERRNGARGPRCGSQGVPHEGLPMRTGARSARPCSRRAVSRAAATRRPRPYEPSRENERFARPHRSGALPVFLRRCLGRQCRKWAGLVMARKGTVSVIQRRQECPLNQQVPRVRQLPCADISRKKLA